MRVVASVRTGGERVLPRLRPVEAVAVLQELRYRAEQRMLEACQEFQDLAFEMEWRLREWQGLTDQRRWLQRDLKRSGSVRARFNVDARRREGARPQERAWARHHQGLQARLCQLEMRVADCAATIIQRNDEGRELESEILGLGSRCERIEKVLRQVRRPRPVDGRGAQARADAQAEALARLMIELSATPDIGDLGSLLAAACVVDERLND